MLDCKDELIGGLSFCGHDVAQINLAYIPQKQDMYVFNNDNYEIDEQTVDGHNGGYFYGTYVKPKEFKLRFLFQDHYIDGGIMSSINEFFRRGKRGKLIFAKREWAYYNATVTGISTKEIYNTNNAIVTVTMKAYYPFARTKYLCLPDDYCDSIYNNSSLLHRDITPSTNIINQGEQLIDQKRFILYNGGTQYAAVGIQIAGDVGQGVIIHNRTTGQKVKIVALSKSVTSDLDRHLYIDSLNGKVYFNSLNNDSGFIYHDSGYMHLKPGGARYVLKQQQFTYKDNTLIPKQYVQDLTGKFVQLEDKDGELRWIKIVDTYGQFGYYLQDEVKPQTSFVGLVPIQFNDIVVSPISSMCLTKLNFIYQPTFQ